MSSTNSSGSGSPAIAHRLTAEAVANEATNILCQPPKPANPNSTGFAPMSFPPHPWVHQSQPDVDELVPRVIPRRRSIRTGQIMWSCHQAPSLSVSHPIGMTANIYRIVNGVSQKLIDDSLRNPMSACCRKYWTSSPKAIFTRDHKSTCRRQPRRRSRTPRSGRLGLVVVKDECVRHRGIPKSSRNRG